MRSYIKSPVSRRRRRRRTLARNLLLAVALLACAPVAHGKRMRRPRSQLTCAPNVCLLARLLTPVRVESFRIQ